MTGAAPRPLLETRGLGVDDTMASAAEPAAAT